MYCLLNCIFHSPSIEKIFISGFPLMIKGGNGIPEAAKGILKICSKSTGEQPCRSTLSVKLQSNFIEISLQHRCSPVNLLHIFRTHFYKNTSGWLLLGLSLMIKGEMEIWKQYVSVLVCIKFINLFFIFKV